MSHSPQPDGGRPEQQPESASSPDENSEALAGDQQVPENEDHVSNQELLEKVLNETLSSTPGSDIFDLIVRFARRNPERKITQLEVAEALVDEVLKLRFEKVELPPECAEFVAASLLDDPDARDRLKRLWAHAVGQANAL